MAMTLRIPKNTMIRIPPIPPEDIKSRIDIVVSFDEVEVVSAAFVPG
jgi:hypothetical protein